MHVQPTQRAADQTQGEIFSLPFVEFEEDMGNFDRVWTTEA
jgi:hypothetical protein